MRVSSSLAADLGERLERAGVLAFSLEEPRVFDGDRHVRGELPQDDRIGFAELIRGVAENVERADDAPLATQRDDELRLRPWNDLDIPWIGGHVVHEDRRAFGHGRANQPLPHLEPP
jgi:hypothetical protein